MLTYVSIMFNDLLAMFKYKMESTNQAYHPEIVLHSLLHDQILCSSLYIICLCKSCWHNRSWGICQHNPISFYSWNMGKSGLPDMYTCCLRAKGCTYQADHKCPYYNYCVTLSMANSLNANHWVLYICTPERTDYGYAVVTL